MATISPKCSSWLIGREEESDRIIVRTTHKCCQRVRTNFQEKKTDEKKAMAKLLHENARPTGQRPRSLKEGVRSKHPIGAPFDGSRQVNCHRLLRGLDVDGFSRFLLLAGVRCLHDDCVIVIVNQCDTGGIHAHWRDCNSKG